MGAATSLLTLAFLSMLIVPATAEAAISPEEGETVTPAPAGTAAPLTGGTMPGGAAPEAKAAADGDAVLVISGGIGDNGIAEMEKQQENYSLKAVFSGIGGIYLSDVDVTLQDASGKTVAHTITQGPVLLAKLKPGKYNLTASLKEKTKKLNVTVPDKGLKTYQVQLPVGE